MWSTGGFMSSEVSGPDSGCMRFAVVFEQIASTDIGIECSMVVPDDLFVSGQEENLMGGRREIALHQVVAMR